MAALAKTAFDGFIAIYLPVLGFGAITLLTVRLEAADVRLIPSSRDVHVERMANLFVCQRL
jgi:hypothetical protein